MNQSVSLSPRLDSFITRHLIPRGLLTILKQSSDPLVLGQYVGFIRNKIKQEFEKRHNPKDVDDDDTFDNCFGGVGGEVGHWIEYPPVCNEYVTSYSELNKAQRREFMYAYREFVSNQRNQKLAEESKMLKNTDIEPSKKSKDPVAAILDHVSNLDHEEMELYCEQVVDKVCIAFFLKKKHCSLVISHLWMRTIKQEEEEEVTWEKWTTFQA